MRVSSLLDSFSGSTSDTVLTGDALTLLRGVPDASVDLVIADPPYNLGPKFAGAPQWSRDPNWNGWCRAWLAECERALRPGGAIFVFGIHHYACYLQVALYDLGLAYRRQFIWYYENGFSRSTTMPSTQYEPLLWFTKGDGFTYHVLREPYKSSERLRHAIVKNGKVWTPNPAGRIAGDVWRFPVLAGRRFAHERVAHPTQKPLALADRIVRHFSNPGEFVLVPFAGSGTECVSAQRLGRRFLGFEISPEYATLANTRLRRPR
ncbi:methyltransferase [Vulcanimicrobium alpinum]|uniref:Methyltransferase n=1 Tax=Vulcanimicrobium alpinum TaxID=3016050 RepID=A0AAN1XXR1_UNVUL|nr:site-specific DNA-methyltransferase [Vulcanimicrobium alpinum]BDE07294.1 methyltransferase [Vulcanimicrobium alpinum]